MGHELSAYLKGGVAEMRAICVQGGRGGQKRPKNCVHTISMAPKVPLKNTKLSLNISPSVYTLEKMLKYLRNAQEKCNLLECGTSW